MGTGANRSVGEMDSKRASEVGCLLLQRPSYHKTRQATSLRYVH